MSTAIAETPPKAGQVERVPGHGHVNMFSCREEAPVPRPLVPAQRHPFTSILGPLVKAGHRDKAGVRGRSAHRTVISREEKKPCQGK